LGVAARTLWRWGAHVSNSDLFFNKRFNKKTRKISTNIFKNCLIRRKQVKQHGLLVKKLFMRKKAIGSQSLLSMSDFLHIFAHYPNYLLAF